MMRNLLLINAYIALSLIYYKSNRLDFIVSYFSGKNYIIKTVLQTDTGGLVKNTKVYEGIIAKEFGKSAPYLW